MDLYLLRGRLQPGEPTRKKLTNQIHFSHYRVSLQRSNLFLKLAKQEKIKYRET